MIDVYRSPNDYNKTSKEDVSPESLMQETEHHIEAVKDGMDFIAGLIQTAGDRHDHTKLKCFEGFYEALTSGHIKETDWYKNHISEERHHLLARIPEDVTLVDVIEYLIDCLMTGMARRDKMYDIELINDVFQLALKNTVDLLKRNINVIEAQNTLAKENAKGDTNNGSEQENSNIPE
jgi:hypothetical protein